MRKHDKRVLHGSACPNWRTPLAMLQALDDEFQLAFDLAADRASNVIRRLDAASYDLGAPALTIATEIDGRYFGPDREHCECRDALQADWNRVGMALTGALFLNPPFSRDEGLTIHQWIAKCAETVKSRLLPPIVSVLPYRSDVTWWSLVDADAAEIRRIPHRVSYELSADDFAAMNRERVKKKKRPLLVIPNAGHPTAVVIWRYQPGLIRPQPRHVTWDYR